MTKLMLCGCTRGDAASLLPLAKSWLRAPELTCDGVEIPYDVEQRAYVAGGPLPPKPLRIEASEDRPVQGLCLIVPGTDVLPSAIRIDEEACTDYKAGIHQAWNGPTLILWLPLCATGPVTVSLGN